MNSVPLAVREVIARVPALAGASAVERLRGAQSLNNDVWIVTVAESPRRFVLRMADPAAVEFLGVRRDEEEDAIRAAAAAGVAPEPVYFDGASGHMVTPWIDAGPEWSEAELQRPERIVRLAATVRRLHRVRTTWEAGTTVFQRIGRILDGAQTLGLEVPDAVVRHRERLAVIERESRGAPVLCHHDLWPNNLLDDGTRLWLIDWEFAGPGDGMVDLATVSLAGAFARSDDERLLEAYGAGDLRALESAKWMVRLFEAVWSMSMQARGDARNGFDHGAHAARMLAALE